MGTAKAATSSGIQRRRGLQWLLARSSNERLLVRRSCHKLLACGTLDCRKCLFSFASCGLVYSISSLIGKIKTPRSTFRPRAAGIGAMALQIGLPRVRGRSNMNCFRDQDDISSARRFVTWSSSVLFRESASVKRFAGRANKTRRSSVDREMRRFEPKIITPTHPSV